MIGFLIFIWGFSGYIMAWCRSRLIAYNVYTETAIREKRSCKRTNQMASNPLNAR